MCSVCICSQHLHAGLALAVTALHVVGLSLLRVVLQMQYSKSDGGVAPRYDEGEDMVRQLQANQTGVDDRLHQSQIQLFKNRQLITSGDQVADEAPDAAAATQDDGSDSEGVESDSEEGDSEDESESESEEEEEEEDDDEEEEEESAGAGASLKAMPQEQIEVSLFKHCHVLASHTSHVLLHYNVPKPSRRSDIADIKHVAGNAEDSRLEVLVSDAGPLPSSCDVTAFHACFVGRSASKTAAGSFHKW